MYLSHFQLADKPFQITSDPKFLWLGEKHKEALATLRYGILDNRGFLLLTGEVGTGKTLLINRLMSSLDQDTIVANLLDPDLDSMDLYNLLADGFKMNRTFDSKGAFLIHLRDFLYQCHANNKQVLLIIDECQRLKHNLIEDIRVLSNIELHDRKLINIFFVGQQEFNRLLSLPQNRAMAQRITVRYHITPLEREEVAKYIFHRLRVAGGTRKIFTSSAIEQIFTFSGGIPRLINILCDHALLTGYARGAKQVDEQIINECAEELRIPMQSSGVEEGGSLPAQDSRSIADAAAKTAQAAQSTGKASGADPVREPANRKTLLRAFIQTCLYTVIVFVLMFLAGSAITHFSNEEQKPRPSEKQVQDRSATILPHEMVRPAEQIEKNAAHEAPDATSLPAASVRSDGEETVHRNAPPDFSSEPIHAMQSDPQKAQGPALNEIEPLPLTKEKITIRFALNSNDIESKSYEMLDLTAAYLIKHPHARIKVRGFTDSSGTQHYNESVSRFRANAVKYYLIGKGVSAGQIQIFAMGDLLPIASNESAEGRTRNRRVEIELDDPLPEGRN
ncbi:MAG: type II secretory pathway protein [Desulfobacteraceae bacterium]|nr:MAG: type II secretory pathway protein [Desulfobacteraceae bacterium]